LNGKTARVVKRTLTGTGQARKKLLYPSQDIREKGRESLGISKNDTKGLQITRDGRLYKEKEERKEGERVIIWRGDR